MKSDPLTNKQQKEINNLYKQNRNRMVGWLITRGLQQDDALDIYQQSVLAVSERLVKNGIDYFRNGLPAYLFSVMKYMYFHEMKKKGPISVDPMENEVIRNLEDDVKDFLIEPDDVILKLRLKLNDLDEKSYEMLRLFYYEGKSMREIASSMGYATEQVAKTTKYRVLNKLRKSMK